jgi:arylsulfatase A-like enzyme
LEAGIFWSDFGVLRPDTHCPPAFVGPQYNSSRFTDEERILFGYITELDAAIGSIVNKLEATGLLPNTFIIFSSDNGAPPDGQHTGNYIDRNFPFR